MIAIRQIERPYTADDLAAMPDDGRRYEVIGGELAVSPSPSIDHQRISNRLAFHLEDHFRRTGSGEVFTAPLDVIFGNHDILQPDLVVILRENAGRLEGSEIAGPPDLVIEIISPTNASMDRIRKSATYSTFGVPEYWIVDPQARTILAQQLAGGQYRPIESDDGLVRSVRIAGLVIDPAEIFSPSRLQAERGETASR